MAYITDVDKFKCVGATSFIDSNGTNYVFLFEGYGKLITREKVAFEVNQAYAKYVIDYYCRHKQAISFDNLYKKIKTIPTNKTKKDTMEREFNLW